MPKTITSVPESITRAEWTEFFERFGLDPELVLELHLVPDGVHAVVASTDEDGKCLIDGWDVAKHDVFIPVIDSDAE